MRVITTQKRKLRNTLGLVREFTLYAIDTVRKYPSVTGLKQSDVFF